MVTERDRDITLSGIKECADPADAEHEVDGSPARRWQGDRRTGMKGMAEQQRGPVAIPMPGAGMMVVEAEANRAHVVRRLLCCGVSAATLRHVLPEWTTLITETEHELLAAGHHPPRAS